MPDEITNAELARRLEGIHRELHDDLSDISRRLDQYVLREVYRAEMEARDRRIDALEGAVKQADDQRKAQTRWVIGAVIVPTVVVLVQIVLALQGPT